MKGDTQQRERETIQTQMDMTKGKERELFEYYKEAVQSRKWKKIFLQALRLFISLQNDSLRVLRGMYPEIGDAWDLFTGIKEKNFAAFKELFPDLYREIRIQIREELEKESRGDAYKSLLDEIKTLQAKLDSLKSLEAGAMPQAGIKTIGIKPIAAPSFDDDDDLILTAKKDESAGLKAGENFIKSMMNLQK